MNVNIGRPRAADGHAPHSGPGARQQPSRRTLRLRLHLTLIALDLACIVASFFLAKNLYPVETRSQWLTMSSALLPFYLACAFYERAYSVQVIQNVPMGVGKVLRSYLMAAAAVVFIAFYLKASEQMSRALFAIGSVGTLILLAIVRSWFARAAHSLLGGNPYTVVLITSGGLGAAAASDEFSVVIPTAAFDPESEDPAMYDRLAEALRHADRVVVNCEPAQRNAWVHALQGANVVAEILAPELAEMGPMTINRAAGMPTLVVARGPLSFANRIIKRAFDFTVALGMTILLAPLLLVVAIAIRLESPGSPLFVQTRIGRGNRQFRMLKFRSMRNEMADSHGHNSTSRADDRITTVGRFIRRTSIDELPQLFNVLIGDMSIVGPRPHALGSRAEDKLFWEIDHRYWHRHAAKPGLTGLAQVRGYRGATNHHIDLINRLHADLEYLDNWTIWRDVKIILMTFRVLMHKNAF